jgi:hypothetical protein
MGAIARNIANNITTSGVFTSSAIANSSVTGITVLANASDGITFISSQTASNSASISFTSGLTSTYKAYKFVYVNIDPASTADYLGFQFNLSTDGGSNYNVTKTSTLFRTFHFEDDSNTSLSYQSGLAQNTSYQDLAERMGDNSDESTSGSLLLFNPSSTTYVKHYIADTSEYNNVDVAVRNFVAGYGNTTSAINAINFKVSSGNINSGTIYMYGIK